MDLQELAGGKIAKQSIQGKGRLRRVVIVPGQNHAACSLHYFLLELYVASCPERNRTEGRTVSCT